MVAWYVRTFRALDMDEKWVLMNKEHAVNRDEVLSHECFQFSEAFRALPYRLCHTQWNGVADPLLFGSPVVCEDY